MINSIGLIGLLLFIILPIGVSLVLPKGRWLIIWVIGNLLALLFVAATGSCEFKGEYAQTEQQVCADNTGAVTLILLLALLTTVLRLLVAWIIRMIRRP